MNKMEKLLSLNRVIILDGAPGTQLLSPGMPAGVCQETWCIENPEVLKKVHSSYIEAGADILLSGTFSGSPFKLADYGVKTAFNVNRKLAHIAREAAGNDVLVAGDIGPCGLSIKPFGEVSFEKAVKGFKEQAKGLLAGGVDLFYIEAMPDIQEARAALIAVKEVCDLFTVTTMSFSPSGRTLNGTNSRAAMVTLSSLGSDSVGCHCEAGPRKMLPLIKEMQSVARHVPIAVRPRAGTDQSSMTPGDFAGHCEKIYEAGALFLGGGGGTTPAHTAALKQKFGGKAPVRIEDRETTASALSSARDSLVIEENHPVYLIGERINPSGKKKLQQALKDKNYSLVMEMARKQEEQGANLLDVNAGMPGIDERETLRALISLLSVNTPLPLVIDSSDIGCMESALRLYPGRALINSITGKEEKLKKLMPIAAKYGAMLIALPLAEKGIPQSAEERIEIIQYILDEGKKHGIPEKDFIIDALVLTVSADPRASRETLKTIRLCSTVMGLKTVIGLSNISFGLPERKWINASFLSMAIAHGLGFAIADPGSPEIIKSKLAGDLLHGRDREAGNYIKHFSRKRT